MEHFAFPGNIDFAVDDQGEFSCFSHSSSVKQCFTLNHEQFPMQMTQNCKHSKWLQILAEEDFPLKLLWRTPIKIHRRADRRRQPRSREHRFSTAKATSSTQRPQTCTEAATKYRKIPKIGPGAYIFQRPFLRGLFLDGLIFGGAYLRREICVSKSIGLAL